jgi:hypothetical protein
MKTSRLFISLLTAYLAIGPASISAQETDGASPSCSDKCCANDLKRTPRFLSRKDENGETVYVVNGNQTWRRTEIEVKRGQKIEVSATGVVRWAPDGIEKIDVTPDGTRPPYRDGWNYQHFPFPEAGIGSLVMRIGRGVYPVGSAAVVQAEDDGFVELMVNDDVLGDNSGFFEVKINVRPR